MRLLKTTLLATALVAMAAPAASQNLPGFAGDYDAADAQFRAYALEGFQRTLTGWAEAVLAGDIEEAMDYYADQTFAYMGQAANGKRGVQPLLESWMQGIDDFRTGLSDFEASGSMLYASVNIVINAVDPADDGDGTMILVLKRQGRNWRIRSQTLVMN